MWRMIISYVFDRVCRSPESPPPCLRPYTPLKYTLAIYQAHVPPLLICRENRNHATMLNRHLQTSSELSRAGPVVSTSQVPPPIFHGMPAAALSLTYGRIVCARPNEYNMKIYETWPTEGVSHPHRNSQPIVFDNKGAQRLHLSHFAIHIAVAVILEESGTRMFLNRLLSLYMEKTGGSLAYLGY
jgi:hypothetical protein